MTAKKNAAANPVYVPEMDGGKQLGDKAVESAHMWVPKTLVPNKDALMRAATVQRHNQRTGDVSEIKLAEETENHIIIAKYLFSDWSTHLSEWDTIDVSPAWDDIDFGGDIAPRDTAQESAWRSFSLADFGVLNLACGKGKTVLALKKISQLRHPAIVIVNNAALMNQWRERALQFLDIDDSDIGVVQREKAEWDKPLVLAMIHTLANRASQIPIEIRQRFGTIIFDEVHHLSASKFSLTAPLFFGHRYGLTATPAREDGLEGVYYSHVGPIFYSDLDGDLDANIYFKKTSTSLNSNDRQITDRIGEFSAGKLYKYLATVPHRNTAILNCVRDALRRRRKVLVLTHAKTHPGILKDVAESRPDFNGYTVGAVSGETPGDIRTKIIDDSDATFATFQIAREGLDVASLDTLIFATPFKAWGAFQQGKGRIERRCSGKKEPIVVVLEDRGIGPAFGMCRSLKRTIISQGLSYTDVG